MSGFKEFLNVITNPLTDLVVDSTKEVVTTIGSYFVQTFIGSFQKSIEFTVPNYATSAYIEQAFYSILNRYNQLYKKSKFELKQYSIDSLRLAKGCHNLRYRNWRIILIIEIVTNKNYNAIKYTIITYDIANRFVQQFQKDMAEEIHLLMHESVNSKLIKGISVHLDYDDVDSTEFTIHKRPEETVYISESIKDELKKAFNKFIYNKDFYISNGIPHQLNILLYGPPGTGKDTIVKMLASIYNRFLIYIDETDYKKIPGLLSALDNDRQCREFIENGIILLSDIDKFPALINEAEIDPDDDSEKNLMTKQIMNSMFGKMINILDGSGTNSGRITIMTTNHIEKFSEAFLRTGRIHLLLEIGYVIPETFRKFFEHYFRETKLPEQFKLKSDKLTIADLQAEILAETKPEEIISKYIKS